MTLFNHHQRLKVFQRVTSGRYEVTLLLKNINFFIFSKISFFVLYRKISIFFVIYKNINSLPNIFQMFEI